MTGLKGEIDHAAARIFAIKSALRPTDQDVGNLAQAYLSAMESITELSKEVAELRGPSGTVKKRN